jgi:replicative DNA helicase
MNALEPQFRPPTRNVEAEKALLGAIMVNPRAYERVAEFLLPEHFSVPAHGRIFEVCAGLADAGRTVDPVTLRTAFERDDTIADIGGVAYLAELATAAAPASTAGEYGLIVRDLAQRRRLSEIGEDIVDRSFSADITDTAEAQIEGGEAALYELAETGRVGEGGPQPFRQVADSSLRQIEAAYKRDVATIGVPTGYAKLDRLLGGLRDQNLYLIAGRPSMGKTSLGTNIALRAARAGTGVAFFSLEMAAEQLARRIQAERARISAYKMDIGALEEGEFDTILRVTHDELWELPLFIDDSAALTVAQVRTRCRRLIRRHGIGLVVIDYIGLMTPDDVRANKVHQIESITRGLKALAKDLRVPVLALSQLSRALEARDDKRPTLADLRDSGALEQDADAAMFVYREEYYLERAEPRARASEVEEKFVKRYDAWKSRMTKVEGTAEVIVAKHRHGPIGTARLEFNAALTSFNDLQGDDQ